MEKIGMTRRGKKECKIECIFMGGSEIEVSEIMKFKLWMMQTFLN